MGFHPRNAINGLFYRTQWININRYGRFNQSPILGFGDYDLRKWWHLSTLSSYIYANAGAVATLVGTLVWVFSHLIWLQSAEWWWVLAVTLIVFLSTTSYAMAFARQNYQILGWMWYPLALYATFEGQYILAALVWLAAAIFAITPIFFAVPVLAVISLLESGLQPLCALLPAIFWTSLRFVPIISSGMLVRSLGTTAKLIGADQKDVRYSRLMTSYGLSNYYLTAVYSLSGVLIWLRSENFPYLVSLGIIFFVINQRLFRVADVQSLQLLLSSLYILEVLLNPGDPFLILGLLIALNPIGYFLSIEQFTTAKKTGITKFKPFDHDPFVNEVSRFLTLVPKRSKVLFCFSDPKGRYDRIFDGYRVIHELTLYVSTEKHIHMLPDWYAVAEMNNFQAPPLWGRTLEATLENCDRFSISYVVVYQKTGTALDSGWLNDFLLISELDWGKPGLTEFAKNYLWDKSVYSPKWFLLRRNI